MKKKIFGLLILLIIYVAAFFVGLGSYVLLDGKIHWLLNLFIADVIATVFVWIVGIFFKTASIYDPYWSVQTAVIYVALMFKFNNFSLGAILFLAFILLWAIRLTVNFCIGFNDISYIDWRYAKIKRTTGMFYQPVSLIGIHLIPTVVVFMASVPSFMYLEHGFDFSPLNIIGLAIMFIGTMLEFVADKDMKKFIAIRKSKAEIVRVGLWKHSRHPNYLGEILFWYGVAFVFIFSSISEWYYLAGAIANTLLFVFISIPLADNNLATYKEGYDKYRKETRCLLPFPRFFHNKEEVKNNEI